MGTRGKIVDVIPQVPKSSHWPPPPVQMQQTEIVVYSWHLLKSEVL